jgi:hypothetical protein
LRGRKMARSSEFIMAVLVAVLMATSGLITIVGGDTSDPRPNEVSMNAAKSPDLLPVNIWLSPTVPEYNLPVTISSQVINMGTSSASKSFVNTIYVDGLAIANQTLTGLPVASSGAEWSATETLGPGYHILKSFADRDNTISEKNEGNNQMQKNVWWASPDLVVDSFQIFQSGSFVTNVTGGEPFNVTATVTNTGDASASGSFVELKDIFDSTETVLGSSSIGALQVNESVDVTWSNLYLNQTGDHVLRATVDAANSIPEANKAVGTGIGTGETNNVFDLPTQVILEWLVLIYMAWEQMEYSPSIGDAVSAMENLSMSVAPTDRVRILAECDREYNWNDSDDSNTRIYEIGSGSISFISDLGELNVGESETLSDFVISAIRSYPARKILLIPSDHGDSWEGFCRDLSGDLINMTELRTALTTIKSQTGAGVDVMAFDACLMGSIEVAYQMRGFVDFMVACENEIAGLPIGLVVYNITTNPSCSASELGRDFVDNYFNPYGGSGALDGECAVINVSAVVEVLPHLEAFSEFMLDSLSSYRLDVTDCRNSAMGFPLYSWLENGIYVDLFDLVEVVEASNLPRDQIVDDILENLKQSLNASVYYCISRGTFQNAHGLTLYFPSYDLYNKEYGRTDLSSVGGTHSWSAFLKVYAGFFEPPYDGYEFATSYCDVNQSECSGAFECEMLNDYGPVADMHTGSVEVVPMCRTGSYCSDGTGTGQGQAIYSAKAGFSVPFRVPYGAITSVESSISCHWAGNYSVMIAALYGAEAEYWLVLHANILDYHNPPTLVSDVTLIVNHGYVSNMDLISFSNEPFSAWLNFTSPLWFEMSVVTFVEVRLRAISTLPDGENGAWAMVDLASGPEGGVEYAKCAQIRILPVCFGDAFDDGTLSPWTPVGSRVVVTNSTSRSPDFSLWISYQSVDGTQQATTPVIPCDLTMDYTVEFSYLTELGTISKTRDYVYLLDCAQFRIIEKSRVLYVVTTSGDVPIGEVSLNVWYDFRIEVCPGDSFCGIYIDGQFKGNYALLGSSPGDTFTVGSPLNPSARLHGSAYWDDFVVIGYPK